MRETRNMAYAYWKDNDYVIEYLLPYIILTVAMEKYPEELNKMPYANKMCIRDRLDVDIVQLEEAEIEMLEEPEEAGGEKKWK